MTEQERRIWAFLDTFTTEDAKQFRGMPYPEYLDTQYWKATSFLKKLRSGFRCSKCGAAGEAIECHHKLYRHVGREHKHLDDLVVLCGRCHRILHVDGLVTSPRRFKQRKQHTGPSTYRKKGREVRAGAARYMKRWH